MELPRIWRRMARSTPPANPAAHRCRLHVELLESREVPDATPLTVLDPNLQVTTVLNTGLAQPIGIVFLGSVNDYLVLEKASGQVKRVLNGVIQATPALDLAVNSNSERGLLSLALHPNFATNGFVYVRWTESTTGADNAAVANVPLLGNRVDRYIWNAAAGTLTFDRNIVLLRSRQTDNVAVPGHPGTTNNNENGNHNGGVIKFGPDGKLYVFMGDQGRRGQMQNLPNGPFLTAPLQDDTFGGPAADNAHLTGVVLRLNDDGTAPADNPFFAAGAAMGGEVGANVQKVFSYGHRNGFGMAFDPATGSLWLTENADDAYSELNRVVPGMNGGWVQMMGPISRYADFKFIETTQFNSALQQVRFPPTRLAYTAGLAQSRMFMLPGATYVDPDFSWRYEIGPAGTAFVTGNALGAEYAGTLWIGSARSNAQVGGNGGSLYRFKMTPDRLHVDVSADPRLADRVADNLFRPTKFDGTESETLQIGTGFGITPDIEQGPDGNLYIVSNTDNAIYKISRRSQGLLGTPDEGKAAGDPQGDGNTPAVGPADPVAEQAPSQPPPLPTRVVVQSQVFFAPGAGIVMPDFGLTTDSSPAPTNPPRVNTAPGDVTAPGLPPANPVGRITPGPAAPAIDPDPLTLNGVDVGNPDRGY